jgi:hypothetical protein
MSIYEHLGRLVGSGPASFFRDACRLMEDVPPYESTTHLVAHLLREIESAIRHVLDPISSKAKPAEDETSQKEKHKAGILTILRALDIPVSEPIAACWLSITPSETEEGLAKRSHRDALAKPRPADKEFERFWSNMQSIFDFVLTRLEVRYLEFHGLMDKLLVKEVPTADDIKTFRNNIPNSLITSSYFFPRLSSPAWLSPLAESGVFNDFPEPIFDGNTVSLPPWPAGEYLKRMAVIAPESVSPIVLVLPAANNPRVHEDLAEALCSVSADASALWAVRESEWIEDQNYLYFGLSQKLGNLVSVLAKGREVDAAIKLAKSLLTVLEDPRQKESDSGDSPFKHFLEPRARFDLWEYEQVLSKNIPDLVDAAGEKGLQLLCDQLDCAILLSDRRGAVRRPEDLSYIWRPSIEEHEQNVDLGLKQLLVTAVRKAVEQLARKNPQSVSALVSLLESRGESWLIFRRIALSVLKSFPGAALDLVKTRLTDYTLFESAEFRHEYFLLAKGCFGLLAKNEQETILAWVDKGPDIEMFKSGRERSTGNSVSAEDQGRYARQWQMDRLASISSYLDGQWKKRFEELTRELGEPKHPEFVTYHFSGGYGGPTSPMTREDMSQMPLEDLVQYLRRWTPSKDWFHEPSPEGLGVMLTGLVSENPTKFALNAPLFENVEASYVRALLQGFYNATSQKRTFEWSLILDLCVWVVTQPKRIEGLKKDQHNWFGFDADWGETRKAIIRLLSEGFDSETNLLPIELREKAWQVILALTHDPEPTPEDENRYLGSGGGGRLQGTNIRLPGGHAVTYAMNTVRGSAMRAAIRYAVWVRRGLEKQSNRQHTPARGFEKMEEVHKVLDLHLNKEQDPSLAVRSVYGENLPWLNYLDRTWLSQNVKHIFPVDEEFSVLRSVAWDAYILSCQPYNDMCKLLREEYDRAINRIGQDLRDQKDIVDCDARLVEHLVTFYWWGLLDEEPNLLSRFYMKTAAADFAKLRAHALEFIGRTLYHTTEAISEKIIERLKMLWDGRVREAEEKSQPCTSKEELVQLGWWFVSRKFDETWSINELVRVLRLVKGIEPQHLVVEHLAEISQRRPTEGIESLRLIVEGDEKGWGVLGWREPAKTIIRSVRRSDNHQVRQKADEVVNLLVSKGNYEFEKLLEEPI